jgi:hypothetical protein
LPLIFLFFSVSVATKSIISKCYYIMRWRFGPF